MLWAPGRRLLVVGLLATITLLAVEALAVSTVMPLVEDDLGDLWLYGWVFSGFFLGQVLGIVVAGWWSDRGAPVAPFGAGVGLFILGLVVGAAAPAMAALVAARVLQGMGAGAVLAVAFVCIARVVPPAARPRMLALLSSAWVLPAVVGPGLAGIVGAELGWRAVFGGLVPFVVVAGAIAVFAVRVVPRGGGDEPGGSTRAGRAVVIPAIGVTAGSALALAGLSPEVGWIGVPLVVAGLGSALPAVANLTPPGTLRARAGLPAAVALRWLQMAAFFGAEVFVPYGLVEIHRQGPGEAGVALTLAALAWAGGAWSQERLVLRVGPRRLARTGAALVLVGIASTATSLTGTAPPLYAFGGWLVAGAGMGLAYAPTALVVLGEATRGGEGAATSGLQLAETLGVAVGTGVTGAVVGLAELRGWATTAALAAVFVLAGAVGVLAWFVGRRLPRQVPDTSHRPG